MNEQESLRAAIYESVRLHPYNESWPAEFLLERNRLMALSPGHFLDIQHIGSTAVPGLSAKPVIDLLAGVESMPPSDSLVELICSAGYTATSDFNSIHAERRWFMRWSNGCRTHHLHVVAFGERIWNEHLRFRDRLRSNKLLADRYAALKSQLAIEHAVDRDAYTNAKAEFIVSVLKET